MAVYIDKTKDAVLTQAEFSPVVSGNFSFFEVGSKEKLESAKVLLASLGQDIVTETLVGEKPMLITQGDKPQKELLTALSAQGQHFGFARQPRSFSDIAWPLRSALGITGQSLQLSASLMRGQRDWGLFTFALANVAANSINLLFGAQSSDDINRLRFLKSEVNDRLASYVPPGESLPRISERRMDEREQAPTENGVIAKSHNFLKHYSVSVGELGLRYLGAFALAFPTHKWPGAWKGLRGGDLNKAWEAGHSDSKLRLTAAMGSIAGKSVALFSKSEDPYDPNPPDVVDTIREKVTFRLGGWVEAASFATLAYDGFSKAAKSHGSDHTSAMLSGSGAVLFTLAYVTRNWAKFGVKDMDMDELYAHVSDSLAKLPPDQLPKLIADTSSFLKDHFKDKKLDYGTIFTQLTNDLYRYHRLSVNQPVAPAPSVDAVQTDEPKSARPLQKATSRLPERLTAGAAGHAQALAARASDTPSQRIH